MSKKYNVYIAFFWPDWWENFLNHCNDIADANDCEIIKVINQQLKPHCKFIETSKKGAYLRWDDTMYHTEFVLRWS
jgi:hypothetical protein